MVRNGTHSYAGMVCNGFFTTNVVLVWLSNKNIRATVFCLLAIPMAYISTETCLVLSGITVHGHELHIDGLNTSCASPIRFYTVYGKTFEWENFCSWAQNALFTGKLLQSIRLWQSCTVHSK